MKTELWFVFALENYEIVLLWTQALLQKKINNIKPPFLTNLKYLPETPSRSGLRAAYKVVWAPCRGVLRKSHNKGLRNMSAIQLLYTPMCRPISVFTSPGCTELHITPVPVYNDKCMYRITKVHGKYI